MGEKIVLSKTMNFILFFFAVFLFSVIFVVNNYVVSAEELNSMTHKNDIRLILDYQDNYVIGGPLELNVKIQNISNHALKISHPVLGVDIDVLTGESIGQMDSLRESKLVHRVSSNKKVGLKSNEYYQFKVFVDPSIYILSNKPGKFFLKMKYCFNARGENSVVESNIIECNAILK